MKIEGSGSASGSGSISQRHGSADPDPDPHQNVMDPQHCLKVLQYIGASQNTGSWDWVTKIYGDSAMRFFTSGFSKKRFPVSSVCDYRTFRKWKFIYFIEDSGGHFFATDDQFTAGGYLSTTAANSFSSLVARTSTLNPKSISDYQNREETLVVMKNRKWKILGYCPFKGRVF